MSEGAGNCRSCRDSVEVHGSNWCTTCWWPGIDEAWQEMRDLIEEGHPYHQAAVLSGYKGAEEI